MNSKKIAVIFLVVTVFILNITLTACTKNVTDEEISVNFQEKEYTGKYTGIFENNVANGEGSFEYKDGDDYLTYNGIFRDGQFSGKGKLKTNLLKVKLPEVTRTGEYDGDVINGIPNGEGEFTAVNDDNETYTYTGGWKDGTWHGQGNRSFEDKNDFYIENGNFENGEFKPTVLEAYIALGTIEPKYTLTEKAKKFIMEHDSLFPTKNKKVVDKYTDTDLKYKHVNKNPNNYGNKLMCFTNYKVVQIWETDSWNTKMTEIVATNKNYEDVINVYYLGKTKLYEGDVFTVYGLPLSRSSWENTGGGTTLSIELAGSYIEKQ